MKRCLGFCVMLVSCSVLVAQDLPAEKLRQQFLRYQSGALQEKLFVHTDKTFYLAGETIWFTLYAMDANWDKPFAEDKIAYVEILNKEGKPVMQGKIALANGIGNGSLNIPGLLNSGTYILRAYTSWMKNFSSDFFFEQCLNIVNTLKTPAVVPVLKLPASIQFFPEGGHAVFGLEGKIGFKAVDGYGQGLDCSGIVVDQQNDTITRFHSLYNGMGNFTCKPEKNNTYYAILRLNDSVIKEKLPVPADQGYVMRVTSMENDLITIRVQASPEFNNTPVYLFVQTRQQIKNIQTREISQGETSFEVSRKDLGDGISTITLFNQSRQPVCERLVFKRPEGKLQVEARPDQQVYETRKPVQILLSSRNADNQPLDGNFSMSVFMLDSLQPVPEQDIVSWLYLSSDLKGKIESPEYYFHNPDKAAEEALDNLLLTQGWRRFKWSEILENKKPYFEFLPELEGPVVNGKIINKPTGAPAGGAVAYFSIPGSDNAFSSATSDAQGNIRFAFVDIYKNNEVVVQPALLKDSNYRVDVGSAWSDKPPYLTFPYLVLSRNQENLLLNRSISNQVENTYAMDKKRRFVPGNTDTSSFYGIPDKVYNLDDYTRFQTMEEVLREYVEDVRVRKDGEHFNFKVRNRLFGTYFEEDPLILLDGIPVGDANKIIALDPLKIRRIELVTHNYFVGSSVFEGIINIKSYTGELGATQIDPNALVVEFDGIQQERAFYSPAYPSQEARENHLPDFRNVLFWSPRIVPGAGGQSQLSFFSSDLKGRFAVVVQGISSNGLPGKAVSFFAVTDSK
jgi:hypothetical protein